MRPNKTSLRIIDCRLTTQLRLDVTSEEMLGRGAAKRVARARQIAMALARELAGASLPKIGKHFGRDHTTVLHAIRRVAAQETHSAAFQADMEDLRLSLNVYAAQNEQARWDEIMSSRDRGADGHRAQRMRKVRNLPSPTASTPSHFLTPIIG